MTRKTIQMYLDYTQKYPHVLEHLKKAALAAKDEGREVDSIWHIGKVAAYDDQIDPSHNFYSLFSREIMDSNPRLKGIFSIHALYPYSEEQISSILKLRQIPQSKDPLPYARQAARLFRDYRNQRITRLRLNEGLVALEDAEALKSKKVA